MADQEVKARDPFVPNKELYELAFDQFSRQYQAKRLIESVRSKRRLKILDVGGNNGKTRQFFPNDEVMVVDLYDIEGPGYTKASALDLPFGDKSYDIVTCFDVFEHIPAPDRQRFLNEVNRVAKSYVLVAAPFDTEFVGEAERELNGYYKKITGNEHRWLKEHIDNGLPKQTEIEQFFNENKIAYQTYNSNNILLWTAMQNLIFLADSVKAPERISNLNRYYNQNLSNVGDSQEPSYRRIYFAVKEGRAPVRSDIEQPVDLEVLRQWINNVAITMHELIYGSEPVLSRVEAIRSQVEMLADKDREIARLRNQLDDILGSRSYRLALTLRATKNALVPKRRK
ncbi:MAG: hypothetical protein JWN01_78 [Patescibacteria group bacterium]|nr:hypothetical protein [Patescibacteria group bacterium]